MRKLLFSLLAFALMYSCTTGPQYTVNVKVDGLGSGIAYLYEGRQVVDSVNFENGEFTFKGSVEMPEHRVIKFSDTMDAVQLFVENTEITVAVEAGEAPVVTGGVAQEKFAKYNETMSEFNVKMSELYNIYMTAKMDGDAEKVSELEAQLNQIYEDQGVASDNFIKENSNCVVGAWIAYRQSYSYDIEKLEGLLQSFDPAITASTYVVKMNEQLEKMKKVAIGQAYIEITQADPEGNMVSLSSFVGKGYVLIDFWASWCGPCRRENPGLVAQYAKYHEKGFEIFGVSFDRTKEDWLKGIEEDGITWPQVSDLKYWDNEAADPYAIRSIPQNVLLDKDGIIIAKNIFGEELGAKLEELFEE